MPKMFEGARLKVEQAIRHIDSLHNELGEFFRDAEIKVELVPETRTRPGPLGTAIKVSVDAVPKRLSLPLGDAIGNMRSALDLVAAELVKVAGEEPSGKLYFPTGETETKFKANLKKPEVLLFGKAVCDLIENEIKPFKGGHPFIWALGQADNMGKHRALIPTTAVTEISFSLVDEVANNRFERVTMRVNAGRAEAPIVLSRDIRITKVFAPSVVALFPAESSFGSVTVVRTLRDCATSITAVIDKIEAAYLSEKT